MRVSGDMRLRPDLLVWGARPERRIRLPARGRQSVRRERIQRELDALELLEEAN